MSRLQFKTGIIYQLSSDELMQKNQPVRSPVGEGGGNHRVNLQFRLGSHPGKMLKNWSICCSQSIVRVGGKRKRSTAV